MLSAWSYFTSDNKNRILCEWIRLPVVQFTRSQGNLKGGIGCGGHFTVAYGGELMYLRIFIIAKIILLSMNCLSAWTQIMYAYWL